MSSDTAEKDLNEKDLNEEGEDPKVLGSIEIVDGSRLVERKEHAAKKMELELTVEEINFLLEKVESRTFEEALKVLKDAYIYHEEDINIDYVLLERLKQLGEGPQNFPDLSNDEYEFDVKFECAMVSDWSPYPEVRASTSMLDDPLEHCETIRMYVIGIIYANAGSLVGVFFTNRFPSISLPFLSLQLLIYPTGKLFEYILPDWGFTLFGTRHSLNPGPWTFKEQMLATQMMSAVDGAPNSFSVVTQQKALFKFEWADSFGYMALLTLTGQFLGYGFAGLLRSVLVYPVKNLWYGILPLLAMNRALVKTETKENVNGWKFSRYTFFLIFMVISFAWWWFPEFVFQGLGYFSWINWISPKNVKLAAVTGVINGLGLNPINTFDWSNIGGASMVSPWYTTYTTMVGQFLGFLVICGIYFSKSYWTQYLPINGTGAYDNTGKRYNVSKILTKDNKFDPEGYEKYSPAYLSAGTLVSFGGEFAFYIAALVYSALYYRGQIWTGLKSIWISLRSGEKARGEYDDPFTRAMKVHPEVPSWWFVVTILIALVLFIVMVHVYPETDTPVWTIFFVLLINIIFIMPMGLLYAQTDNYFTVSFFVKVLMGYLKLHNANAVMISEFLAGNFWEQAQNYITNQKQTHYAKMPSRALFRAQFLGTFVTVFTNIALLRWEFTGIDNYCSPEQSQKFTCQTARRSFASSILWGTLGPKIYFDGLYPKLKYCFLIGFFLPFPVWLTEKYYKKHFRRWNVLLVLSGFSAWAPSSFFYTIGNFYIGALFNFYLRNKYLRWWQKYNYILYAALGTGIGFGGVIMFFATGYKHIVTINWWGNTVPFAGADSAGTPLVLLPKGEIFGPAFGNFPNPG